MFKTKSFNLVHKEDKKKKKDVLYQPMRCSCIKFFLLPGLIAFSIMCILFNVDFSNNSNETTKRPIVWPTKFPTFKPNTSASPNNTQPAIESSYGVLQTSRSTPSEDVMQDPLVLTARATMYCSNIDDCTIECLGGHIEEFSGLMITKQKSCQSSMEVTLIGCEFEDNYLVASHFQGNYKLKSFEIERGDLEFIYDNSFKSGPVVDLERLVFFNTKLLSLRKNTLNHLKKLEELRIVNHFKGFDGDGFLEALASNLKKVTILEESDKEYDPGKWLGGKTTFTALEFVDLKKNRFPKILTVDTFKNFISVATLILQSCHIEVIGAKTFDRLLPHLQVLDLSLNKLSVLDGDFLIGMSQYGLHIHLHGNPWKCTCENSVLISELKKSQIEFDEEPQCHEPNELLGTKLRCIVIPCGNENDHVNPCAFTTTPEITTTTTSTKSDTTSTSESTTMSIRSDTTSSLPEEDPPDSTSSEIPKEGVRVYCQKPNSGENSILYVETYDMLFTITSESSTSVRIFIPNDLNDHFFIHFNASIVKSLPTLPIRYHNGPCVRASTFMDKLISELEANESYVFCLILDEESRTSPFNCKSHFMMIIDGSFKEPWLDDKDKALFISMTLLGLLVFYVFGILSTYLLLRCCPWLLKGSKRLVPSGMKSKEMLLLPKNYEPQASGYGILENQNSTNTEATYDSAYMPYYKPLDLRQQNLRNIQTEGILAPYQAAPPIPLLTNDANPYIIAIPNPGSELPSIPSRAEEDQESIDYEPLDFYEEIC